MSMDANYTHYMDHRAPQGILCEFMREGWDKPHVCKPEELWGELDTNGLYWRMTGIGRERWESMTPGMRAQLEAATYASCAQQQLNAAWGSMSLSSMLGAQQYSAYSALIGGHQWQS